jgi:hypothetical protein
MSTTGFNVVSVGILLLGALAVGGELNAEWPPPVGVTALVFLTASFSPQVARQWEKAIVLRLGRFRGSRGPGSSSWCPSSSGW